MLPWPFRALWLVWTLQPTKPMPWRNQLIHGYATVRVGTVWNVLQNALPPLLAVVEELLGELGQP